MSSGYDIHGRPLSASQSDGTYMINPVAALRPPLARARSAGTLPRPRAAGPKRPPSSDDAVARALRLSDKAAAGERLDADEMAELVSIATSMLPGASSSAAAQAGGGGAASHVARREAQEDHDLVVAGLVVADVVGSLFPEKRGPAHARP